MSKEAMEKELGIEPEAVEVEVEQEEEAAPFTEETYKEKQEDKARSFGWKPLEEYIEDGKDPNEWVSAEMFNMKGDFIGRLKNKDRDVERIVNERVAGVKKLYEGQIKALTKDRDTAISDGDVQRVHELDQEINSLRAPPVQHTNSAIEQWNNDNPWINEVSPKSSYAKEIFAVYANQGITPEAALQKVEADLAKSFPATPKKPAGNVPASEKGAGAKGFRKSKSPAVSEADLTRAEKMLWGEMPEAWGNDINTFLKAVQDDRSAGTN